MHNSPDKTASMEASATAFSGLPAESGRIVAAMRPTSAESGPRTIMRLGPKTA